MGVVPAEPQNKATLYFPVPAVNSCPLQSLCGANFFMSGDPFLLTYVCSKHWFECVWMPARAVIHAC